MSTSLTGSSKACLASAKYRERILVAQPLPDRTKNVFFSKGQSRPLVLIFHLKAFYNNDLLQTGIQKGHFYFYGMFF